MKKTPYMLESDVHKLFRIIDKGGNALDALIFRMLYYYGMRVSEAVEMPLTAIDQHKGTITVVRLKGSETRTYELKHIAKQLTAWLKVRPESPFLFPGDGKLGHLTRATINNHMIEYCWKAKIKPDHPHALKHSAGMVLVNEGYSAFAIQDHLGHKTVGMTKVYASLRSPRRNEMTARLAGKKRKKPPG